MRGALCKYTIYEYVYQIAEKIILESISLQKNPFLPKFLFFSLSVSHYFKKQRSVNRLVEHSLRLNLKFKFLLSIFLFIFEHCLIIIATDNFSIIIELN